MNGCAWAARAAASTLLRHVGNTEGDVVADARGEEKRVLRDDADLPARRPARDVAHVDPVDQHAPRVGVVEARHERGERRLACARGPDQRDRAARLDLEVDALEHGPLGVVAEPDAGEDDPPGAVGKLDRGGCVGHLLRLVDYLEEPLSGCGRALRLADPHAEHAQRHHEHHQQQVEGEEAADRGSPWTT